MVRLFVFLILLPISLLAQNVSYPSPGKAVGLVVSEAKGEWAVLSQDFTTTINPVPLNDGMVCWFEGIPGTNYAVLQTGEGGRLRVTIVKLPGLAPTPPDPPKPPDPPTPPDPPQPPPIPGVGFRAIILYETAASTPESLLQVLNSTAISTYLNSRCVKNQFGVPEWRRWDDDYSAADLNAVSESLRVGYLQAQIDKTRHETIRGISTPWLIVSDGVQGESIPLPNTIPEVMLILKKYGG